MAALAGRHGVLSVEKGWLGFSEINRVAYRPAEISMEKMENILKEAGTYIKTVPEDKAESR